MPVLLYCRVHSIMMEVDAQAYAVSIQISVVCAWGVPTKILYPRKLTIEVLWKTGKFKPLNSYAYSTASRTVKGQFCHRQLKER